MLEFLQVESYHGDCDKQKRIKIRTWYRLSANFYTRKNNLQTTSRLQCTVINRTQFDHFIAHERRYLKQRMAGSINFDNGFLNRAAFLDLKIKDLRYYWP